MGARTKPTLSISVDDIAGVALWMRWRDRSWSAAMEPHAVRFSKRLSARFAEWITWHGSLSQNDDELSEEALEQQWEQFDLVGRALAESAQRELGEQVTVKYFWVSLREWETL